MENYLKHVYLNAQRERKQMQNEFGRQENLIKFQKYLVETSKYFNEQNPAYGNTSMRRLNNCLISFTAFLESTHLFELLQNSLQKEAIYNKGYWHLTDGYLSASDEGFDKFMKQAMDMSRVFCDALLKTPFFESVEELENFVHFSREVIKGILSKCENEDYKMSSYQLGEMVLLKDLYISMGDILNCVEFVRKLRQL